MKFEDAVGKWCLIKTSLWSGSVNEALIVELSPSGKYVRYRLIREENSVWAHSSAINLLEILRDKDKYK